MPEKFYSRPRDKSLQAYKDWIIGITKRLNPDAKDNLSEEKWVENWQEFWSKSKGGKGDSKASAPKEK